MRNAIPKWDGKTWLTACQVQKLSPNYVTTWVPGMKPSWQQVRVNSTEGGAWMPEWCKNVYKHPKMRQVNWWQTMASWPTLKVQIKRRGGASYTSKFMFWGKIGLIWAKPAQIWSVHMSNVSMTNTDTVPAGGSINIAGSKDTFHLSHLKWTKRSSN